MKPLDSARARVLERLHYPPRMGWRPCGWLCLFHCRLPNGASYNRM